MIVIRRLIAILLIPIFLLWFTASTFRSGIDNTLFDDSFLAGQLEEQDFYNWLHDDLIRVALDERVTNGVEVDGSFLPTGQTTIEFADPVTTRDEARALLRATFPPEYLQETTSQALAGFMPYVRGEADDFEIPLELNERVSGFFAGVENTYLKIGLADVLVDELITPVAIQSASDFTEGPFGLVFTPEQAGEAAREIAPPEWIDEQVLSTLTALDLYLSGQSDTLAANISFKDRVPVAADVTKRVLTEANADQVIFDKLIKPQITEKIGQLTLLSYQVTIGDDEITDAYNRAVPAEWVNGHVNAIIDNVAAYMSKESDSLAYTIDLSEPIDGAVDVIAELAVAKATAEINTLFTCASSTEAQNANRAIVIGGLPDCTDSNLPLDKFLSPLVSRLTDDVKSSIGRNFPTSATYDESLFTSALAGQGSTNLEGVRDKIANGITITDDDLLERLSEQAETAEAILDIIRTGRPFTLADFERFRGEPATARDGVDSLESIDMFRGIFGLAFGTVGAAAAAAMSLLLLFVIGRLGGRAWTTRLIWAASALIIVSLIVWLAIGQIISGAGSDFVESRLIDVIDERIASAEYRGDPTGMLELARDEGVTKARGVSEAIISEFASYAFLWLAGGVIAIMASIAINVSRFGSIKRYSPTGHRFWGQATDMADR